MKGIHIGGDMAMAEKMDRHGVRYVFEHRLLPNWFYEDKDKLVGAILHDNKY